MTSEEAVEKALADGAREGAVTGLSAVVEQHLAESAAAFAPSRLQELNDTMDAIWADLAAKTEEIRQMESRRSAADGPQSA
jgi:hypothetical protein